jgi:hypothetical protein
MADARDELARAREDARRARDEASRLRNEARDMERRLREESRHGRGRPHDHDAGHDNEPAEGGAERAFSIDGVRDFSIDQTAGHLTVRMCADGEVPGVVTTGPKGPPDLHVRREGDRLVVEVHMAKGWLFRRRQGPRTVVRLWAGLSNVRVNIGYGELQLRDIACDTIKLDVGAGTATAYATAGEIHADVAAGKLTLNAHRGLASCSTGTGDVTVDIAEVVPGDYKLDVGMGRAEIRLPAGAQVYIKSTSGIGKSRIDYPVGPESSPTHLRLNTGIGEVVVRAREAASAARPAGGTKPQRPTRPGSAPRRHEAEELRVLQMLEQGRISSQDAADLIAALQGSAPPPSGDPDDDAAS